MLHNFAPTTYAAGAKHRTHSKRASVLFELRYSNPLLSLTLLLVS